MKKYQPISELIKVLEKEKNVLKNTIDEECFREKTYIEIVTPFSDLMAEGRDPKTQKHIYPKNIDFNNYVVFCKIDSEISKCFHQLIGCFEKLLKTFLIDTYCSKMIETGDRSAKNFTWCSNYIHNIAVFDLVPYKKDYKDGMSIVSSSGTKKRRKALMEKIIGMKDKATKNALVLHYQNKYSYVPMYVVIHTLTMGELNTLFCMLSESDKKRFMRLFLKAKETTEYSPTAVQKFINKINRIQIIRNIVNHYEPITPFILNTKDTEIYTLTSTIEELKRNYDSTKTFAKCIYDAPEKPLSKTAYQLPYHKKLAKVINSLK